MGLAESGDHGLHFAKDIYSKAITRIDELVDPYRDVIDINTSDLPDPEVVAKWSGTQFAITLRHDRTNRNYNLHFRQLLHVGYKLPAEKGNTYADLLKENCILVEKEVTENILKNHLKPLFL